MLRPMNVLDASEHVFVFIEGLLLVCGEGPCVCSVEEDRLDELFEHVYFLYVLFTGR